MGTTMREQRIIEVLKGLSNRLAEYNTTMDDLIDSFNQRRMVSMQIRKRANRCIDMADTVIRRFLAIADRNHIDADSSLLSVFDKRRMKFIELELFFH